MSYEILLEWNWYYFEVVFIININTTCDDFGKIVEYTNWLCKM